MNHTQSTTHVYSLDCTYFTQEFPSIEELIAYVTLNCCDPSYEITKNGVGTGEQAIDLIQF